MQRDFPNSDQNSKFLAANWKKNSLMAFSYWGEKVKVSWNTSAVFLSRSHGAAYDVISLALISKSRVLHVTLRLYAAWFYWERSKTGRARQSCPPQELQCGNYMRKPKNNKFHWHPITYFTGMIVGGMTIWQKQYCFCATSVGELDV